MTRTALALLLTGSASANPDMLITVDNVSGNQWRISSEFFTIVSYPIVQIWMDTSFELTGDGSPITITSYNPSYDTMLGNAAVTNGPTATFVGNATDFFGTVDPSNPLDVIEFEYAGSFDAIELTMVGQNGFLSYAHPFGTVELYQDANGNPGPRTWDVRYIPAPATLALVPLALVAAHRSRT